jgi:hypothetical protein
LRPQAGHGLPLGCGDDISSKGKLSKEYCDTPFSRSLLPSNPVTLAPLSAQQAGPISTGLLDVAFGAVIANAGEAPDWTTEPTARSDCVHSSSADGRIGRRPTLPFAKRPQVIFVK